MNNEECLINWTSPSKQITFECGHRYTEINTINFSITIDRDYNNDNDEYCLFEIRCFNYKLIYYWICSPRYYWIKVGKCKM